MTLPRRVLPNRTYLVTRRCSERRFFLRPDPVVVGLFEYLLAVACARHAIELHGFVCMSNHYHLVVTDRDGRLPAFMQYLNSLLARSVNRARGRWEAFWTRESYSAVELLESEDVVEKLVYTLVNPVRAGLVERARGWGGATSATMGFGERREVERPGGFFGETMPERAVLELTAPSGVAGEVFQVWLEQRIGEVEDEVRTSEQVVTGMRAVLRRSWGASPSTRAIRGELKPRFAAKRASVRVAAIVEFRRWVDAYREALARFVGGEREVEWPWGTYWMGRLGCPVAG